MLEWDFDFAYTFYRKVILPHPEKLKFLQIIQYEASNPTLWEYFGACLTGKRLKKYGPDLEEGEVKSAKLNESFQYQYNVDTGLEKHELLKKSWHLFVWYSNYQQDVLVYAAPPRIIETVLNQWDDKLKKDVESKQQRCCRKSISKTFVKNQNKILEIIDGKINFTWQQPKPVAPTNSNSVNF